MTIKVSSVYVANNANSNFISGSDVPITGATHVSTDDIIVTDTLRTPSTNIIRLTANTIKVPGLDVWVPFGSGSYDLAGKANQSFAIAGAKEVKIYGTFIAPDVSPKINFGTGPLHADMVTGYLGAYRGNYNVSWYNTDGDATITGLFLTEYTEVANYLPMSFAAHLTGLQTAKPKMYSKCSISFDAATPTNGYEFFGSVTDLGPYTHFRILCSYSDPSVVFTYAKIYMEAKY